MPSTRQELCTSFIKLSAVTLLIALFAGVQARAQNPTIPSSAGKLTAPTVEDVQIIIESKQVRIAARSNVTELKLQIFDSVGALVYDSGLVIGPELSWELQNGSGEAVPSGLYSYSISVKEAGAEKPSLRSGHMIVERGHDRDPQTDRLWVTSQGPGGALSGGEMTAATGTATNVAGASIGTNPVVKPGATTNLTGFGTTGSIPKFGGGDYLLNSVISQDAGGRIGIGTTTPSSLLTVAGQIETKAGGVKFPDGTVQSTSAAGSLFQVNHNGSLTGNGTNAAPLGIASGQVVKSLNGLSDNVSVSAGSNITITPSGNGLSIAAPELFSDGGANSSSNDTDVTTVFGTVIAGATINNLPAGNYIYSANVYITPIGGPAAVTCIVIGTGGSGSTGGLVDTTVASPQWIPIIGRLSLDSLSGAVIKCSKNGINNFKAHGGLTVVRVKTVY